MDTSVDSPRRSALALVLDRQFGAVFWGKLLTASGVWVHSITAAIVVYQLTGSALSVGLVSVAQFAPQLLLTPLSGSLADRGNPVAQILLGRLVCLVGSGVLAVWFWAVGTTAAGAASVTICSFVVGLGFVLGGPAMQSIVPSMVRPAELETAMALNTLPMTVARIAGPAFGAYIAAHHSPAIAFAIAAVTHGIFMVLIAIARIPRPPHRGRDADYSVRAALSFIRSDRPLVLLIIGVSAVALGAEPAMTLAPPLSRSLTGDQGLVGWLVGSFGVGAGIGFVLHSALHTRTERLPSLGLGLMAVGLLVCGLPTPPAVAIGSFAVAGVGFTYAMTSISTLIQRRAPDALRGRILAIWLVGFIGTRPIAAALEGSLADAVSLATAFVVTAMLIAAAAVMSRSRYLDRPVSAEVPTAA
ncbi:MFS transporter [Solicola gregarius]|uniref:MFS transporter n=1 Tax=Solicola gregarius TaxID=2908642 RepID=A0AA46YIT2_9ACTN|nr:MFS transporter [Solicola gregarius]UYM03495.1 MFS transporter [Solicola gregarius]